MRFDHPENQEIWFTVKEEPTMRDVLLYDGNVEGMLDATLYTRLWSGVKWLVDEWHCKNIQPDEDVVKLMEKKADPVLIDIIKWAGLAVFSYRQSLEPEKN